MYIKKKTDEPQFALLQTSTPIWAYVYICVYMYT